MNGYVRSRSRFHGKRARERAKVVDMCNVTRSRRSNIFSSRREECVAAQHRFRAASQELFSRGGKYLRLCSSIRGYDSSFLLRFRNTFPNSLPSENDRNPLGSRIPRSWNSTSRCTAFAPPCSLHFQRIKAISKETDNRPNADDPETERLVNRTISISLSLSLSVTVGSVINFQV